MNLFQIAILVFCFIETLSIIILYFKPDSTMGNGVGVFDTYHNLVKDTRTTEFIKYLVNWVAGCKLIFIMVGVVVVIFGDYNTQLFTVVALIIPILLFYWRLFPAIKRLDKSGEITPKGYSKTLNYMIVTFVLVFAIVLVIEIIQNIL